MKNWRFNETEKVIISIFEFSFYFLEKGIILTCLIIIAYWGFKIFIQLDHDHIRMARSFLSFMHEHWIGILFLLPLVFYRIVIRKLQDLEAVSSLKFRKKDAIKGPEGTLDEVRFD